MATTNAVPHLDVTIFITLKFMSNLKIKNFIEDSVLPIMPIVGDMEPWNAIKDIDNVINNIIQVLDPMYYDIADGKAIHKSAKIEKTAQLKGSMIIGPNCFVANGSLLRGGVILDSNCIVGHCGELKTSIMFAGSKIAHLNFVGDSILGKNANVEGGAVIANYRNEFSNKDIHIPFEGTIFKTGLQKFGAILGDNSKVGANATIAPGAIISKGSIIKRSSLVDQSEEFTL